MKIYPFFVLYLFIATVAFPMPDEMLSDVQRTCETQYFSKGISPKWEGVARIYFKVMADPDCKKTMLAYVEEKLRHDADFWPEVVPLYLQLGGAPALVVELLPSFTNPKTVALAQLYLMVQGESSSFTPSPIKNTSTTLKASLRHEGDFFVVSVENIDPDQSVLFVRENYSVLSVCRADGIALPARRSSLRGRVDETNLIVLRPGDCYEFKVSTRLGGCHPTANASFDAIGWYSGRMGGLNRLLWGLDGTLVGSSFDRAPIPLVVQFVYDPSRALLERYRDPELLTPFINNNKSFNPHSRKVCIDDDGIVASNPVSLTVSVPRPVGSVIVRPVEESPIGGVWNKTPRKGVWYYEGSFADYEESSAESVDK